MLYAVAVKQADSWEWGSYTVHSFQHMHKLLTSIFAFADGEKLVVVMGTTENALKHTLRLLNDGLSNSSISLNELRRKDRYDEPYVFMAPSDTGQHRAWSLMKQQVRDRISP